MTITSVIGHDECNRHRGTEPRVPGSAEIPGEPATRSEVYPRGGASIAVTGIDVITKEIERLDHFRGWTGCAAFVICGMLAGTTEKHAGDKCEMESKEKNEQPSFQKSP